LSYYHRGNALTEIKRFDEALRDYDRSLELASGGPVTHTSRGNVLQSLRRFDEALRSYDRAIQLNPAYPDAHVNRGVAMLELYRFEEALESFDHAIELTPDDPVALNNRGNALKGLRRFDEALLSYDRATGLAPAYALAYANRGTVLAEFKRFDEAQHCFERAIHLKPDYPEAHYYLGMALKELKRFDESQKQIEQAIQLKPDNHFWLGDLTYIRLGCCDWSSFEKDRLVALDGIIENRKTTDPFTTLHLTDLPEIQLKAAMSWCAVETNNSDGSLLQADKYPRHDRIRLGYFSADYRDHPVMHLIAELFEKHDRTRFEVHGFSFGPESADPWRIRAEKSFEYFHDVRLKSDQMVAEFARDLQIDIAVDLTGHTAHSRPGIFARRAAPVQVNYLGFPGNMGAGFMDYILADETVIPEDDRRYYTEKVVYMPHSFQVNCRERLVSQRQFTRQELGLPAAGFVFCCFNNNYKITPTIFDSWMRILRQVEGSVFWIYVGNTWAADNLRREAERSGISRERLVFASRVPVGDHLNRLRSADLFLDTLPFNAGTTASDALRMGVPLVTLMGNALAGRYASSLLKTLNLGELITHSTDDYETLAIDLALNHDRLRRIRERLMENVETSPLFDSELFTRHIERAFTTMYERNQNDLVPDHMVVEAIEIS
jgi:predicted O-linked N-acetylglucosamine transferase (SPINDLY family)